MALTLQQLRVLVAVVEHRSFTRGAQAVYMTQSAASQHVRALEGALGTSLLERAGGEVVPTQAGEALAGFARDILRLASDAERHVAALRDGRAGRLALGASGSAVYLAPALIAGFRAAHAGIEVGLEVRPRAVLLAAVAQGTLDAALVAGPVGPAASPTNGDFPDLESHVLCPDRIVLAVCPTSPLLPLAALGPIPLGRLAEEPIVTAENQGTPSPSWRTVERWAGAHGVELHPTLRLEGVDAVKKTVEAGIGIAFLSAWVVEREVALGTLRLVAVDPPAPLRHYTFVRRPASGSRNNGSSGSSGSPALDALVRFAPDYLGRHVPAAVLGALTRSERTTIGPAVAVPQLSVA
jgi:DNA-binding transcriptional LysR family regulator